MTRAIAEQVAILKDKNADAAKRADAARYVIHFVGDLHQPLHVGSVYLDPDGKLVDPDAAHAVEPNSSTIGGNAIHDQNVKLHGEWDDIPTDIGDAATRELLAAARVVPATPGVPDDWPAAWATDTVMVAHEAFAGLTFTFNPPQPPSTRIQWLVAFEDHTAYLWLMDQIKRKQLAKGGARLAELLNTIWP